MDFSLLSNKYPYKVGLALSGGGVKGFAHAGAILALEEAGIKPDIISGTSAGAIVGALYAAGHSPKAIYQMFLQKEFFHFAELVIPKTGIFSPKRFRNFIEEQLRAETFEDLDIPLHIVATDFDNGHSVTFTSGILIDKIMASCCFPIVFPPVQIDGVNYVDGGIFKNFPVSIIRPMCETVIGINASPLSSFNSKLNLMSIAERSYHYMFRANTVDDCKQCDILIQVTEALQYKTFDLENVENIFMLGYEITKNKLEEEARKKKKRRKLFG